MSWFSWCFFFPYDALMLSKNYAKEILSAHLPLPPSNYPRYVFHSNVILLLTHFPACVLMCLFGGLFLEACSPVKWHGGTIWGNITHQGRKAACVAHDLTSLDYPVHCTPLSLLKSSPTSLCWQLWKEKQLSWKKKKST